MEALREIIAVLKRFDRRKSDLLDPKSKQQPNKYLLLYKGIESGRYKNDIQAEEDLYGPDNTGANYRVLKARLKEYLLSMLAFLDMNDKRLTPYQQALYLCHRDYFCAKFLINTSAKTIGTSLAKAVFTQAEKFHLTDMALLSARLLRHRSSWEGNVKEFKIYQAAVLRLSELAQAEARAEECHEYLYVQQRSSTAHNVELLPLAREFVAELDDLWSRHKSNTIFLNKYRVKVFYYSLINDYNNMLEECREAEQYMREHTEFFSKIRLSEILTLRMTACLALRRHPRGLEVAEEALQLVQQGGSNWFITMEVYFLLCMHTLKFGKAASLLLNVVNSRRLKSQPRHLAEKWLVYEAYLKFVVTSGWAERCGEHIPDELISRVETHAMVQDTPHYAKDKLGLNTAILIVQILYLLSRGDHDEISGKMDALERYNRRYLNNSIHFRTYCFFRMLALMEHKSFDGIATKTASEKWLHKMRSDASASAERDESIQTDLEADSMANGIEVLPYEELWDVILEMLEKHQRNQRSF